MQNPTPSILSLVYAVPDDSAFHKVSPGVEARTRADGNLVVVVQAEYVNGDPNLGYVDGCPAALLASETAPSTLLDTGSDAPGVEWWVLRAPTSPPVRVQVTIQTKHDTAAEAHVWAQGVLAASKDGTVVGTDPDVVVDVASGTDLAYVLDVLDEDDLCFAYTVG